MKMKLRLLLILLIISINSVKSNAQDTKVIIAGIEKQTKLMIDQVNQSKLAWANDSRNKGKAEPVSPRTLSKEGSLVMVPAKDWTSGFFPGELWYLYEFTKKIEWKVLAQKFTANIEDEK